MIIKIISQGAMTAAIKHMTENPIFNKINKHPDNADMICKELRTILRNELPGFLDGELKEATESKLGEGWIKKIINTQCNKWGIDAISQAQLSI